LRRTGDGSRMKRATSTAESNVTAAFVRIAGGNPGISGMMAADRAAIAKTSCVVEEHGPTQVGKSVRSSRDKWLGRSQPLKGV
jgi:hypothetical protein